MQSKYKIVLSLAQELGVILQEIQKYVQWYKLQTGINYDFVNGHSFELENDIKTFIAKVYLSKKRYAFDLEIKDKLAVQGLKNKIIKGEEFVFPIAEVQSKLEQNTLFTIGYEGISIDTYINKLLQNYIKTLVDVRKNAYSNKFGFSKKESHVEKVRFMLYYIKSFNCKIMICTLDAGMLLDGLNTTKYAIKGLIQEERINIYFTGLGFLLDKSTIELSGIFTEEETKI